MRNKLLSSLAAAAFGFATGGFAFAADMAAKAPASAPAPVYNWTGWYAGVNAGASFGNVRTDFNDTFTNTVAVTLGATGSGGTAIAGSDTTYPSGFIGGGQIGYNWQLSPIWVVGLEADFQGALERDSHTVTSNFSTVFPVGLESVAFGGSSVLDYQTKIDWFGTVRGRIGYVWGNGTVYSYVTGGLAYGRVELNATSTVSGSVLGIPYSITDTFGHSHVNTGWVVGYGTEGVIDFWGARNWTWKVEGLYMDLGTLDATGSARSTSTTINVDSSSVTAGPVNTHSHFTDGILRAGLNYKFY